MMDLRYPGIGIQAVSLTLARFSSCPGLSLRRNPRNAEVSPGVVAATGGIMVFYLAQMLLGFFGVRFVSINGSGVIGIASA